MAGNVTTIATWIAGLTISGVTILDLDALPATVNTYPVLMPDPSAPFVTDLRFERQSFSPGSRVYTLRYTLNYVLFYRPIGEGVRLFEFYKDMVSKAMAVAVAFVTNETPTGAKEIVLRDVPHLEIVTDTSGKGFHGAKFALDVLEINQQ